VIAPPPETLHVEGAAHETRIVLEHGRPRPPTVPWKRAALALWFASFIVAWFVPILFCPLGALATLGVGAAYMIDTSRSEVERLVLRQDHLSIVRRGLIGRVTAVVPWSALDSAQVQPAGRGRHVLVLTWHEDQAERSLRLGTGRAPDDLHWMGNVFSTIVERLRAEHRRDQADETRADVESQAPAQVERAVAEVAEPS